VTLEEFASAISFRFVAQSAELLWYDRWNQRLARIGLARVGASLEVANTRLPADRVEARPLIRQLLTMPRMSTYAVAALINKAVHQMPSGTAFVNVGVWHGFSFLAGAVANPDRRCIAIDNFSQYGSPRAEFLKRFEASRSPRHEFHDMDYVDYFARVHSGAIGFYFYDGEHSYRNQYRGLEAAEPFFAAGCVILVDDTNADEPRRATLEFINRSSGKYRLLFDRRTTRNSHPTFWNGVMGFART